MLTRGGKRGKDESVTAWETYEREHAKNAQEEANNCGVWLEFEEYGLRPDAEWGDKKKYSTTGQWLNEAGAPWEENRMWSQNQKLHRNAATEREGGEGKGLEVALTFFHIWLLQP